MSNPGLTRVACEGGYYYKHDDAMVSPDAIVGPDTKVWSDAQIYAGANIGRSCIVGAGVHIENDVILGSFSKVQRGVVLYKGIITGDYVFFGPNATTTNDRNPRSFGPWELTETHIGIGASIGANATLVCGIDIGPLALVGAGSVVTRNVKAAELVVGNPAKHMGWVDVGGKVVSYEAELPEILQELIDEPIRAIKKYIGEVK